jgi:hypothetical protein
MGFHCYDTSGRFIGEVSDPIPLRVDAQGQLHVEE